MSAYMATPVAAGSARTVPTVRLAHTNPSANPSKRCMTPFRDPVNRRALDPTDTRVSLRGNPRVHAVAWHSRSSRLAPGATVGSRRALHRWAPDRYSGRTVVQAVAAGAPGAAAMRAQTRLAPMPVIVNAPGTTM